MPIHPFDRQAAPEVGDIVSVVSYAADRSEIPSIEDSCSVLFTEEDVLVLSCSVNFGSSGAPIFVTTDARPKIASVVVAMTEYEGRQVSLAVGLDGSLDTLVNRLKQTDPVFVSRKPGMTTIADQLGRTQTASPFVGVP